MSLDAGEAKGLSNLSDDELYLGLGRELSGDAGVPQGLGVIVERGKAAFKELAVKVRPTVCGSLGPNKGLESMANDTLIQPITTAILSGNLVTISEVAALYVAVLIARIGLRRYCAGYTDPAAAGGKEAGA